MPSIKIMPSVNRVQVIALLSAMAVLVGCIGYVVAGWSGFWWALAFTLIVMFVLPGVSAEMVTRLYSARPLRKHEAPLLYQVVDDMLQQAGVSQTVVLFYMPSRTMNAFTVGKGRAASIVLSSALIDRLSFDEIVGVLAHEVSHIVHDDVLVMTTADVMSRVTAFFSTIGKVLFLLNLPLILANQVVISWWLILLLIFAPSISVWLQYALSRGREFEADKTAAILTQDPLALASALQKIEGGQKVLQWMVLPRKVELPSFLRTHPSTEDRIERLKGYATEMKATLPRYRVRSSQWHPAHHRSIVPQKNPVWGRWWF